MSPRSEALELRDRVPGDEGDTPKPLVLCFE